MTNLEILMVMTIILEMIFRLGIVPNTALKEVGGNHGLSKLIFFVRQSVM